MHCCLVRFMVRDKSDRYCIASQFLTVAYMPATVVSICLNLSVILIEVHYEYTNYTNVTLRGRNGANESNIWPAHH